jgi:hypothetical protein
MKPDEAISVGWPHPYFILSFLRMQESRFVIDVKRSFNFVGYGNPTPPP